MPTKAERPSEAEVKRALQGILVNRDARAVNWAVNYAREGLDLEGERPTGPVPLHPQQYHSLAWRYSHLGAADAQGVRRSEIR